MKRLLAIWLLPTLCLLAISQSIYSCVHIETPAALPSATADALLRCVRTGLRGTSELADEHRETVIDTSVLRLYRKGRVLHRKLLPAGSLHKVCKEALDDLRRDALVRNLPEESVRQMRLRFDVISARGPVVQSPELLASLSLEPALDGVGVRIGDAEYVLLPSELADRRMMSSSRPLSFVPDFTIGFDRPRALGVLKKLHGLENKIPAGKEGETAIDAMFRFRVDSFAESESMAHGEAGPHLSFSRDVGPSVPVNAKTLRDAALLGGRYLVAHMSASGRYFYLANVATGKQSDPKRGPYSLPRHAGTTYFLAELYRHTGEDFLREPIERAIGHMAALVEEGKCGGMSGDRPFVCVADKGAGSTDLGSTALAVVALAEYERATQSQRFRPLMLEMSEFLLHLQRRDGSFSHVYHHREGRIESKAQLLYYSGEAALALARVHLLTGEARYLDGAEAALDWLTGWYDFFLGGFFFGEEHWTCIAAEAVYPALKKASYLEFCQDYARFSRDHQVQPGEYAQQDEWAGTYKVSPFLAPQNTPAGSRSEAMLSTFTLGRHHGIEQAELWQQIEISLAYLLRQQMRPEDSFRLPERVSGVGALTGGPVDRDVRIDYVQHVCSAMIRASDILASPPPASKLR